MPLRKYGIKGFSLIEVLIAVALIGILLAIAAPNYSEYVLKGRLTEAFSGLSTARTQWEQYYQDNRSYVGWCSAERMCRLKSGGSWDSVNSVCNAGNSSFTFTCDTPAATATTYTLTATGIVATDGLVYTINEANARTTAVTAGSLAATQGWTASATCWRSSKGGCL